MHKYYTTELPTNETGPRCSNLLGDTWYLFLASYAGIYVFCLLSFSAVYGVYWLVTRKHGSFESISTNSRFKAFRNYIRHLKSGDTIPGKILITGMLLCNLAFLGIEIQRSFKFHDVEECISIATPTILIEVVLVCVLFMYFILRFMASKNLALFWIDIYTIVDVCTLPHVFIALVLGVDWIGLRTLRFIWLTQITTVLQLTPLVRTQTAVDALNLLIYFVILWLTSSGILQLIEAQGDFWRDNENPHSFFVYVYLMMVTMSTVGYGDISPKTDSGRAFVVIFIVAGLAFFAAILPKLVDITTDFYAMFQYAWFDRTRVPKHVIVCGHVTAVTAEDFLKDFLHPDRGDKQIHILFLHPEKPDNDLKNVLHKYYTRVQFILGSVLNQKDLSRAQISSSRAIFILANKYTRNPIEEDRANLLRVVSVKNTTDQIPVIIQLLHSFSKVQVENIEGWSLGRDIAVCLNELKLGLLAQSCICPGFSTLIANLFYTLDFPTFSSFTGENAWKSHYFRGASNEVYSSTFSSYFSGMTFQEAASVCFTELELILLALEHIDYNCRHYYVNPSLKYHPNLRIMPGVMLGYFIAPDQSHVSSVDVYCKCCPDNVHWRTSKEDEELKREISLKRRNASLRRKQSEIPEEIMAIHNKHANGDLVIRIDSSSSIPMHDLGASPRRQSEGMNHSRGERRSEDPVQIITLSDINLHPDTAQEDTLSIQSCLDDDDAQSDVSQGGSTLLHVCKPFRLEERILNLDLFSLEDKGIRPRPRLNIRDHIVLCLFADHNSPLLGLQSFLKPLRSKHLPKARIKPVVIICDEAFIAKEWPIIRNIPELYVVEGSPLLWSNLSAANVINCSVCVVLSLLRTSTGHELAVDDKEAILCSLSIQKKIKSIGKNVLVITDLRQESNVQFLDFGDEDTPDERIYKAQPFACGEAFSVSMFDSVTSSAFHGPGTLYLVEDLIYSSGVRTVCNVVTLPLEATKYPGMSFGEFYNEQLQESNVCMGVSRKLRPNSNQSYVITSPDPKLILEESDVAFILTE